MTPSPDAERPKRCNHCWHDNGSWTNGLNTDGEQHRLCCHCGRKESRRFSYQRDTKHGSFSPVQKFTARGEWYLNESYRREHG
jgi:transposase-like protein